MAQTEDKNIAPELKLPMEHSSSDACGDKNLCALNTDNTSQNLPNSQATKSDRFFSKQSRQEAIEEATAKLSATLKTNLPYKDTVNQKAASAQEPQASTKAAPKKINPKAKAKVSAKLNQGMKAQFSFDRKVSFPGFGLYVRETDSVFIDENATKLLDIDPKYAKKWLKSRTIFRILGLEVAHQFHKFVRNLRDETRDPLEILGKSLVKEQDLEKSAITTQQAAPSTTKDKEPKSKSHLAKANDGEQQLGLDSMVNAQIKRKYLAQHLPGESNRDRANFNIILRHGAYEGTKLYVKLCGFFMNGELSHINITLTRVASYLFELVPHVVADSASFDWIVPTGECTYGSNYYTILGYDQHKEDIPQYKSDWMKRVVHPDDIEACKNQDYVINGDQYGNNFEMLYRSRCHDGSYIWTKSIGTALSRDQNKHATRILGINIDINRVLHGYEQLQSKVFTDILTGLKNRTYLVQQLPELIEQSGTYLTVLFADVTALKAYNDYLGHNVGDKLLCSATVLMQDNIKRPKELIRMSGDEVLCVLPNCDEKEAHTIKDALDKALSVYNESAPIRMPVFFSFGTKTIDVSEYSGRELEGALKDKATEIVYKAIGEADMLMQEQKKRNHEHHYSLVKAYIEQSLKRTIVFNDKRLF